MTEEAEWASITVQPHGDHFCLSIVGSHRDPGQRAFSQRALCFRLGQSTDVGLLRLVDLVYVARDGLESILGGRVIVCERIPVE